MEFLLTLSQSFEYTLSKLACFSGLDKPSYAYSARIIRYLLVFPLGHIYIPLTLANVLTLNHPCHRFTYAFHNRHCFRGM